MDIYIPEVRAQANIGMIVTSALEMAYKQARAGIIDGEEVIRGDGGFGGLVGDSEIRADEQLAKVIARTLLGFSRIRCVKTEGFEKREVGDGDLIAYVDPLDASLDYKHRCGSHGLPYTSCITLFHANAKEQRFCDVLAAGVIDLRNGDLWTAIRGEGAFLNGKQVRVREAEDLDPRRNIFIAEMYYAEFRWRIARVFEDLNGYVRSIGSAAYEMALVASGTAAAYFSGRQKHHELGAGYLLVTEAGGIALTLDGRRLSNLDYDFGTATPVVLASSMQLAQTIVSRWGVQETT